jgi:exosortase
MVQTRFLSPQRVALLRNSSILAISMKTLAIAISVLVFYYQDLSIVFSDGLQNEAVNYVLLVPFLFIYFLYRKRKMVLATISNQLPTQSKSTKHLRTLTGILVGTTAIVLYWYSSYTFTPLEYHMLTLPVFTAGLVLILFNPQTLRQLLFPVAFLIFLAPPPLEVLRVLGSTLSVISSEASNAIVGVLGVHSIISSISGVPALTVTQANGTVLPAFLVDISCSGIYPVIGFFLFAALVAYVARDKTWKKVTVFLVGLPLMYLLNIVRLSSMLMIGYYYGDQLALQVFHLLGGFVLIIVGTLLVLVIAEKLFKTRIFDRVQPIQPCTECGMVEKMESNYCERCGRLLKYPSTKLHGSDVIKIAVIAVVLMILISFQAPVLTLTQGPAQITIQTPTGELGNTQILPKVFGYSLSFVMRDKNFEEESKQDASLLYIYNPESQTKKSVFVAIEIASSTLSLHPWEVCLITWPVGLGYQPPAEQLDLRNIVILENPPITARYFAFNLTEDKTIQLVLYWFETSIFNVNGTAEQKQVKISLISYPDNATDVSEEEKNLLPFATAIANYWQPVKTWTQVALIFSQNGMILASAAVSLLACTTLFYSAEKARDRKAKTNTYNKLSETDQGIIGAVLQQKGTLPSTLQNIAATYESATHTQVDQQALLEKLLQAEETGIVTRQIVSRQDEPLQVWKAHFSKPTNKGRTRWRKVKTVFTKRLNLRKMQCWSQQVEESIYANSSYKQVGKDAG